MIVLITGIMGTGKTTIYEELLKKYGLDKNGHKRKVIHYTTRPKRNEEENYYNHIITSEWKSLEKERNLFACESFQTKIGLFKYGIDRFDFMEKLNSKEVYFVPIGVEIACIMKKLYNNDEKLKVIGLNVNTSILTRRLARRNDDVHEVKRRLSEDRGKFFENYDLFDLVIENEDTHYTVEKIYTFIDDVKGEC